MNILLTGEGGQGIQVLAKIISSSAYKSKINISYIPHYGVEMRMGISMAFLIISKKNISYPKFSKADLLIVMTIRELELASKYIGNQTKIINVIDIRNYLKSKNINQKALNMVALGIIAKELNNTDFKLDENILKTEIENNFSSKKEFIPDNIKAFENGLMLEEIFYNKNINSEQKVIYNPVIDSDSKKSHIKFPNLCKGCGLCLEKCPVSALTFDGNVLNYVGRPIPKVDINKCISCMVCEQICPDSAIKIIKKS